MFLSFEYTFASSKATNKRILSKGFITQPDSQLQETSKQNQTKISYAFKISLNSYKNRIAWIEITWTRTVYFLYYRLTFKQQIILTELGHSRHGAVISSRNHHAIAMYCIDIILHCSYCPAWFAWDSQFIFTHMYYTVLLIREVLINYWVFVGRWSFA